VLDYPWLPLTNNEAERALRHWVIARRIGNGTRTVQGTLAFANLASIIGPCRKRYVSPWPNLAAVTTPPGLARSRATNCAGTRC
jgi:hypothetical protein